MKRTITLLAGGIRGRASSLHPTFPDNHLRHTCHQCMSLRTTCVATRACSPSLISEFGSLLELSRSGSESRLPPLLNTPGLLASQSYLRSSTMLCVSQVERVFPPTPSAVSSIADLAPGWTLRVHVSRPLAIDTYFPIVADLPLPMQLYPDDCQLDRDPALNERGPYTVCPEFCKPRCHPRRISRRLGFE